MERPGLTYGPTGNQTCAILIMTQLTSKKSNLQERRKYIFCVLLPPIHFAIQYMHRYWNYRGRCSPVRNREYGQARINRVPSTSGSLKVRTLNPHEKKRIRKSASVDSVRGTIESHASAALRNFCDESSDLLLYRKGIASSGNQTSHYRVIVCIPVVRSTYETISFP
jgi:hypothetical protein